MIPAPVLPDLDDAQRIEAARLFAETMASRRTIRDFAPDPVPRAVIENAVRAAGLAPSGANKQPWFFAAVGDPAIKAQIREAAEEEERAFYGGRAPPEWLADLAPFGTTWRKPFLETAPWLIVCFQQSFGLDPVTDERSKNYYVPESVGIACGFLIAALHQAGLATLTHTPSPMGFLRELLGRPVNERALMILVVGKTAKDATVPNILKKPLSDILKFY